MTEYEQRSDRFTATKTSTRATPWWTRWSKIGKVDDLFLDENDQPSTSREEGFLGTSSTDPGGYRHHKQRAGLHRGLPDQEHRPGRAAFDDDSEITPEYENEVRFYYGLGVIESSVSYGDYEGEETNGHSGAGTTDSTTAGTVGSGMSMGDTETGEFREHAADDEGVHQSRGDDLADEDELRSSA